MKVIAHMVTNSNMQQTTATGKSSLCSTTQRKAFKNNQKCFFISSLIAYFVLKIFFVMEKKRFD